MLLGVVGPTILEVSLSESVLSSQSSAVVCKFIVIMSRSLAWVSLSWYVPVSQFNANFLNRAFQLGGYYVITHHTGEARGEHLIVGVHFL